MRPDDPAARAVVLDHTALHLLGTGNRFLSTLVTRADSEPDRFVQVPALCLAAAAARRPALFGHVGALPSIEVIELGFADASAVGDLVAMGTDWRMAHAVGVGRPTAAWPKGLVVITTVPDRYDRFGVVAVPVPG